MSLTYAKCPTCRRKVALLPDGTLKPHKVWASLCTPERKIYR